MSGERKGEERVEEAGGLIGPMILTPPTGSDLLITGLESSLTPPARAEASASS